MYIVFDLPPAELIDRSATPADGGADVPPSLVGICWLAWTPEVAKDNVKLAYNSFETTWQRALVGADHNYLRSYAEAKGLLMLCFQDDLGKPRNIDRAWRELTQNL